MSVSVLTVYQALATTCDYIISCKKIRYEHTVDSDTMDSEEDYCDDVEEEAEERRLARRRRITVLSIVGVFLICGVILTMTVVYDVQARAGGHMEWEEFSCPGNDESCLSLLCPDRMEWEVGRGKGAQLPVYTCCTTCTHDYTCYGPGEGEGVRCCHAEGVVLSSYKQVWRPGYLWVQWKRNI